MATEYKSAWTLIKWFGAILLFLFIFGWLMHHVGYNNGEKDTLAGIKTEIQIDTLWQEQTDTYSKKAPKPSITERIDTLYLTDSLVIIDQCDSVRTYPDSIIHMDYDIHYKTKVCGLLLNTDFKVDLKVPREILKTVTQSVPEYKPYRATIYAGGQIGVNPKLIIYPVINLALPKAIYSIGYDPMNKSYMAGVGVKLFKIK